MPARVAHGAAPTAKPAGGGTPVLALFALYSDVALSVFMPSSI